MSVCQKLCLPHYVIIIIIIVPQPTSSRREREYVISCALDDDVYEQWCVCIKQELLRLLQPFCQQMETSSATLRVCLLKLLPSHPPSPPLIPQPLVPSRAHQAERNASISASQPARRTPHNLAAGCGSHPPHPTLLFGTPPPSLSYHAGTNLAPHLTQAC